MKLQTWLTARCTNLDSWNKEITMKYGNDFKRPAGAASSDTKGERKEMKKDGVGMGKMDAVGKDKKFDTGRTEGICYEHKRGD